MHDHENCMDEDCEFDGMGHMYDVKVGHKVPNFTLEAYEKGDFKNISLYDAKGKWKLLFFYPLDFTFVCPTEILELSKRHKEFEALNTQVMTISIDSVHSHKAWSKEIGDLNFPMLSDLGKEVSLMYNVLHDDGMSLRATFLISPDNVLEAAVIHNLNVGRNIDEHLRVLEAFQTGELCGIGWKKGDKTLGK